MSTSLATLIAVDAEDRLSAANTFASSVTDVVQARKDGLFAEITAVLKDSSKQKANARASALAGLRAVFAASPTASAPYLTTMLPLFIEAAADKAKHVAVEAEGLAKELVGGVAADAVGAVMPAVLAEGEGKWQANLLRADLLSILADKYKPQVNLALNDIVPVLSALMWDTKPKVKEAAVKAMADCCGVMDNRDIKDFVPSIIECIQKPQLVAETVHKLAGVVFVSEVFASALAVMAPLLKRGFDEPTTSIKRNCARITENMAKLVDDPYEVEPFVPVLLPALAKAKEEVADPECRTVCQAAYDQLKRTASQPPVWKRIEVAAVRDIVSKLTGEAPAELLDYAAAMTHSKLALKNLNAADWKATLTPVLALSLSSDKVEAAVPAILEECAQHVKVEEAKEEADDAEQLCDCQFSLAYGNKVLLNQTVLKLKRGYRYGLCGKNDSGKTSLMRAIANQQVEGFPPPTELRTMFVETDVQGDVSEMSVIDYVVHHEGLKAYGITYDMAKEKLLSVGFALDDSDMAPASLTKQVGRLSGGWRMKLALVRAMLMKADILLLDEPTNHLDPGNVKWVIDYLTSLQSVTSIIVSHDIKVLDQVCTHVLQIDNLKLKQFKGNLTHVAQTYVPELMSYFQLKATKFTMRFPQPGPLEGVSSKGKHIMKMTNITFTYPGAPKAQLTGVTVRVSLSTRAACIGANGAGKSTMIKLLTGELQPDKGSGDVWKHPNCRVAYVAQHAFHHIEHHLEKTPNEYIRWRYEHGSDKEGLEKVTAKLTEEDEKRMKTPMQIEYKTEDGQLRSLKCVFKKFTEGRRTANKSKEYEYEVRWQGASDFTTWVPKSKLEAHGFSKLLKHVDDKIAALATQLQRPLTQKFVENHLNDVGLAPEFATHTRMGALSGGQKVKVVLAASMWNTPHIVILDEPTNYLDRDSLGAMAEAINAYDGGIVIISHNAQFVDQVCPEVWHLENHTLNLKGSYDWLESANKEAVKQAKEADEYVDGLGNTVKIVKKKKASKAELKKIKKAIAEKRKAGIEVYTDEELEAHGFDTAV
eukprot:CAMPEP_0119356314 /NCGR_PEP_ID=MMETSP1334-20130426/4947_1 /TAXON_ID=127549 /ORGANISM="Calcidiscus leptoporus, Strain RCC1130" /LENGTH=1043 /DNA_ID=CAMNT_0007370327 /DNA_START=62 /DNA_END=3193 /DNA_ORIENTATION=+